MSFLSCGYCWDMPCTCGHDYVGRDPAHLRKIVGAIQSVLDRTNPDLPAWEAERAARAQRWVSDRPGCTVAIPLSEVMGDAQDAGRVLGERAARLLDDLIRDPLFEIPPVGLGPIGPGDKTLDDGRTVEDCLGALDEEIGRPGP